MRKGKLTLVGAGPGDPELISVKGLRAIEAADILLYDALVHPSLLDQTSPDCVKIFVGKRDRNHAKTQDETNELIVFHALNNQHVVRLKGGDPFIFGRGQEEIDYAENFDIHCETVLGISSVNLPGYYGMPLTQRGINESFWAVTATTRDGNLSRDLQLVAQSTATAVIFMGLGRLSQIMDIYRQLHRHDTPVAIISNGSLDSGRVIKATVAEIEALQNHERLPAPALIVIGEAITDQKVLVEVNSSLNQVR
jgi:uroporphyrin-III C-methyltransferase